MKALEINDGDIVLIDYIEEFTKKRVNEGLAIVLWKGINNQPLIVRVKDLERGEYNPTWHLYSNFKKKVGHIDLKNIFSEIFSERVFADSWGQTTDLRNLPNGTWFHVVNGNWVGYVFSQDENKYMHIKDTNEDKILTGKEDLVIDRTWREVMRGQDIVITGLVSEDPEWGLGR